MPVSEGKCSECGAKTSKFTATRCAPCNHKFRKGKPVVPKKKVLKEKICAVCGKLNHINFSQEKILRLKEQAYLFQQQHDFYLNNLKILRAEHRRWENKIEKAKKFHDKLLSEVQQKLWQLDRVNKNIKSKIIR